jgi:hypothetical protein
MATLDQIVDEVTSKYGLGSQGGPLVRELLTLVTVGWHRWIHRLPEGAGLGKLVSSWLGKTDAAPMSVRNAAAALKRDQLVFWGEGRGRLPRQ